MIAPVAASKKEWLPVGDDDEQHEEGIERAGEVCEMASRAAKQARADDEGVADVHARYCGVGVVERADETVVEVDAAAGDGVDEADPGQSRRRSRVDEEADEGESAREQERRAHEREDGGPA